MATQAFKVQTGTLVIAAGQTTGTITAGVDYDAPSALSSAFIKINSTRKTGMGRTSAGGNQNTDDWSARISNPGNLLTSIDFVRAGTANNCRITWEIVEYVGAPGGANEFIVRDQATITASSGATLTGSTVTTIADIDKACLWLTSQSSADTGRADWHEHLWTGDLVANASDWDPQFSKLAANLNSSAWVSYAVIEFTGSNWRNVQRIETTTTTTAWTNADTPGAGYTVAIPTTLLDTAKAFLHCQYATSNDATGLDDAGETVTIDSTTNLRLWSRNTAGTRRKVVWVIENTQADGSARNMTVQHDTFFRDAGGTEERSETRSITAVAALAETSLEGTVSVDGGGTAYPRGAVDLRLTALGAYTHTTSDAGQEYQHAIEVIEWPEDPDAAGASTTGTIAGGGTLAGTPEKGGLATATATGGGAMASTVQGEKDTSASQAGGGTTTATGLKDGTAAAAATGGGALAAAASAAEAASTTGAITGGGAIASSGQGEKDAAGTISGAGQGQGQAQPAKGTTATATGAGSVSAADRKDASQSAGVTGSGDGAANLVGSHNGAASTTGGGSTVATASSSEGASTSGTISAGGQATATSRPEKDASASQAGGGTTIATGLKDGTAAAATAGGGALAALTDQEITATAATTAATTGGGQLQATALKSIGSSGQVSGSGQLLDGVAKAALIVGLVSGAGQLADQVGTARASSGALPGGGQVAALAQIGEVESFEAIIVGRYQPTHTLEGVRAADRISGYYGAQTASGEYEPVRDATGFLP